MSFDVPLVDRTTPPPQSTFTNRPNDDSSCVRFTEDAASYTLNWSLNDHA